MFPYEERETFSDENEKLKIYIQHCVTNHYVVIAILYQN